VQARAQTKRVRERSTTLVAGKPGASSLEAAPDFLGLSPARRTFVAENPANGFNATKAYLAAHPGVGKNTTGVEGWRLSLPETPSTLERPRSHGGEGRQETAQASG
jgi:hypothetical protein